MIKANRIQEKARNVGFDWEEPSQVWDKVKEEINDEDEESFEDDDDYYGYDYDPKYDEDIDYDEFDKYYDEK